MRYQDNLAKEIEAQRCRGVLVVISGPTCAGKDSVVRELEKNHSQIYRLVTTNSRPKRPEEKEGVDYYFVSRAEFEKLIEEDAFFEWVEYRGEYRGTQKKHIQKALKSGRDVIWRIDVRGVKNIYEKVKKEYPYSVFIFIAEDLAVLEKRMKRRASEDKRWQSWSLARAAWELKQYHNFDYLVINEENKLSRTAELIKMIIEAERRKIR